MLWVAESSWRPVHRYRSPVVAFHRYIAVPEASWAVAMVQLLQSDVPSGLFTADRS